MEIVIVILAVVALVGLVCAFVDAQRNGVDLREDAGR